MEQHGKKCQGRKNGELKIKDIKFSCSLHCIKDQGHILLTVYFSLYGKCQELNAWWKTPEKEKIFLPSFISALSI